MTDFCLSSPFNSNLLFSVSFLSQKLSKTEISEIAVRFLRHSMLLLDIVAVLLLVNSKGGSSIFYPKPKMFSFS